MVAGSVTDPSDSNSAQLDYVAHAAIKSVNNFLQTVQNLPFGANGRAWVFIADEEITILAGSKFTVNAFPANASLYALGPSPTYPFLYAVKGE